MTEASWVLRLAHDIAHLDATDLSRVLTERGVVPTAPVTPLSLAAQLASPDAVVHALEARDAKEWATLDNLNNSTNDTTLVDRLQHLLLVTHHAGHVALRDEVVAVWPQMTARRQDSVTPLASDCVDGGVRAELSTLINALEAIETVLVSLESQPVSCPETPETTQWADNVTQHDRPELNWSLWGVVAWRCGLIGQRGHSWMPTVFSSQWRRQPTAQRASLLVHRVWDQAPEWFVTHLRTPEDSDTRDRRTFPAVSAQAWAYWTSATAMCGLTVDGCPTELAHSVISGGDLTATIAGLLGQPAGRLYADGPDSVMVTGILDPSIEYMLRQIGTWLGGGLAARYRVSQASVLRALHRGVSATAIKDFVAESIPGGPDSPIGRLIDETLSRAQAITLTNQEGHCGVMVSEPMVATLLTSDRRLAPLNWITHDTTHLESPLAVDTVHRALLAEGYPHTLRDASGELVPIDPTDDSVSLPGSGSAWATTDVAELLDSWQSQLDAQPANWFEPFIDLAMAGRVAVVVDVELSGDIKSMHLELRGFRNGRLRARDLRSDVERTIPASHIRSIVPEDPPSPEE